jgi:shikimate kinase
LTEKNIVLIGFMGTGKSAVGKILARRLKRSWVDVDQEIEEAENRKISEIFEKYGEIHFRLLEKKAIQKVASGTNLVITTGGGAVLDAENRLALKKNGLVITLSASAETIFQRVRQSRHRPLLKGDLLTGIRRLLAERDPFYRQSDYTFSTDGKTAAQVAEIIEALLEKETEFEFGMVWF